MEEIFWDSPHQVDMKNVFKSSKHFFVYFYTLETHSEVCCLAGRSERAPNVLFFFSFNPDLIKQFLLIEEQCM